MRTPERKPKEPMGEVDAESEERDARERMTGDLADGSLDPDEVDSWLEPWDEGSDDEL
jgi:hypothetical protein